ncbi:thioredoxin family protein [uncultured Neptuniibacter sp.]|uniref:thioredoxin family protein n=1 Tax=uncultured Neptuniibacter sp. TaxID=502143 RepID=UPI002620C82F|nr:thioredoxin family protein [uncultured Neptuniibacter sp.]
MKQIIVLGSGCAKCIKTAEVIEKISSELGVDVQITKEASPEVMMNYGVMSTPAVVIDGTLVHSGRIPSRDEITAWIS